MNFRLVSKFKPTGDQPRAIKAIVQRLKEQKPYTTLLGVTGSGKTFTLAAAIEKLDRPVLVISHNKTLASQLYAEFRDFFPQNSVEYFVSYYDYYQPESYIPQTDTYIEKDASINERLDRLRLSATSSLVSRRDVLVVASVSCIYNLGSPEDYQKLTLNLSAGRPLKTEEVIAGLVSLQYERNDYDFKPGTFRLKGDNLDIFPAYRQLPLRFEFFTDCLEKIYEFESLSGKKIAKLDKVSIYPAKHFIIEKERIESASQVITRELNQHLDFLKTEGKLLEAQRLRQRTLFDLEMLKECGYCHGIENYSRHLSGRPSGSRPFCLIDYFPEDFITLIDESHVTVPQLRGMYEGDRSRKQTLVDYGFRLPSCLDNRPLRFDEFRKLTKQTVYVSATPAEFETNLCGGQIVEQIIRPTGLPDPQIQVRPSENQISDLIQEIKKRTKNKERTLVTTLTKRMAEDLAGYLFEAGLKASYIHSEIDTLKRSQILKDLRLKKIDILVGINLLREGLDLPEVSLVAILDADKEGFLRSASSLIQVAGRCARNINGKVIMYADTITKSMQKAISESNRRRKTQISYNARHKITPRSIVKAIGEGIEVHLKEDSKLSRFLDISPEENELLDIISQLQKEMDLAAKSLHFEKAAELRDKIADLHKALKK
ncbi:MAG: excinuclease ABC subunit UvrB [Candidatus Omnitrophica bacterium]|nr:excinuclease ABC subunit UvrB [Candidatus Omnitrophota bacterium]